MSLKDIVRNNTIEAWLRMKSMGLDLPRWDMSLPKLNLDRGLLVRKWQSIYRRKPLLFVERVAAGYVSPDLLCPFTGGMIVRKP